MNGTLAELVVHLPELKDPPDSEPLQLFVEDVPVITGQTAAMICNEGAPELSSWSPSRNYRYVLMLCQAQEVLERWTQRHRRAPTVDEACRAILFFSENDRHMPQEDAPPSGRALAWPVLHRRGDA